MLLFVYLQVIDHYENPRNVGSLDKDDARVGTGLVGAPACGDVMKLQVGQPVWELMALAASTMLWSHAA